MRPRSVTVVAALMLIALLYANLFLAPLLLLFGPASAGQGEG